jgi:hypothetical protein
MRTPNTSKLDIVIEGSMLVNVTSSMIHPRNPQAPRHMAIQLALFVMNVMWGVISRWVNIMTQRMTEPSMAYEARSDRVNLFEGAWWI